MTQKTLTPKQEKDLEPLVKWLRFPSISTDPSHNRDTQNCANFMIEHLQKIGLDNVQLIPTKKHPIIYADWCHQPNKPTILIYGHYDVQPVDPIDEWTHPPFEPRIHDGYIYARGVADNKGQIFCHITAIKNVLEKTNTLPVNIKLLIEGEEEIGSPNLMPTISAHKDLFSADIMLISDNPMFGHNQPSICCSLRGLSYVEVTVKCLKGDLHSGQHGGAAPNAIHELIRILSQLNDQNNKILIPGFYESVTPINHTLKHALNTLTNNETQYKKDIGSKKIMGDPTLSIYEKCWYHPTLDINGIIGGFTQEGGKTVIPATAHAKISMRLVPNQDPEKITQQIETYLKTLAGPDIEIVITPFHGCIPAQMETQGPYIDAAKQALKKAFGVAPLLQGEGGSIPIVAEFQKTLGIQTIMMGLNNMDDHIHAPNERMRLSNIEKGIQASMFFLEAINDFTDSAVPSHS